MKLLKHSSCKTSPEDRSLAVVLIVLGALLAILTVAALSLGRYKFVTPGTVCHILISSVFHTAGGLPEVLCNVVMDLRLPRVIAAVLIGAALALSGATYQGIFKNPLVSPDLLGVSGGACVGASLAILGGLPTAGVQICAFLVGLLAVAMTVFIPRFLRRDSTIMLVLSGVIVGGFMSSVIGITKYVADVETQLPELVFWQLGSIAKVKAESLLNVGWMIVIAGALLIAMRWRLNVLSLEDRDAKTLGIHLQRERGFCILLATLLTASAVCLSGTIGWVGLVIPHLARMIIGTNNDRLLPVTALLSGCFMLTVDTAARTLVNAEIPLGILTGLIGAPFFIFALMRERRLG